ncbi:MAG: hypothetical protein QXU98_02190 [Candidatus Parvarchaeota archaeon]
MVPLGTEGSKLAGIPSGQNVEQTSNMLPEDIVYKIPIIINNRQNVSTVKDFQQELVINSSEFSEYEASNLQNVEFFYENGSIVPSWLESGNTNNSTRTIYWLKLANGIPAKSSLTIYMGFAKKSVNLLNAVDTGEAPSLSKVYGEYDDGFNVFMKYWNFNGTTLPYGWKTITNSQPVAGAYYDTNATGAFEVIDQPSGSRWVTGISTGYNEGSVGYAFVFYPGVSYWGDDGTTYGLWTYNSTPSLLSTAGPNNFPIQIGVGYNGKSVMSIYGSNLTSTNSSIVSFSHQNLIFVSSDTWGVGGGASVTVNNGLILSVSIGSSGQITTETNFVAVANLPPEGVMPSTTVDGYFISFNETGYPAGKQWSVIVNNNTYNSSNNDISIIENPGVFTYSVLPGYGLVSSPSSGILDIINNNITISVKFVRPESIAEAPITIINNQTSPTGIYQQLIRVNSRNYSKYINSDFSNIEFCYQNSTLIPAWIEEPTNNTSSVLIVLKLYSIPAKSSITIYMVFYQKNVSLLSEYGPTGEGYYSTQGPYLSGQHQQFDDGKLVFYIYSIFDVPYLPPSWSLTGSAQFIPNQGIETVNGNDWEMGAAVLDGNLSGGNITVWANTYYQGSADQQNFGVYATDPSGSNGDNGGVGESGYTIGFDPYYSTAEIYYNGTSVHGTSFWSGGSAYFITSISVNSNSINSTIFEINSNVVGYFLNYSARIEMKGGLFFSSSTGASNSVQFIYDIVVLNSPPDNYMPSSVLGNATSKKYEITFDENGLKNGTEWYLNISGQNPLSSSGRSVTTELLNGTYYYTISSGSKDFEPSAPSGNFTVDGMSFNESVSFLRLYYANFTEVGLPEMTLWYINISGYLSVSSTSQVISINLPNGSYSYSVGTSDKRYSCLGGTFTIDGSNSSISLHFVAVKYPITFIETGLPPDTEWYVNITGLPSLSSNTSKITTSLTNGTYEYTVATGDRSFAPITSREFFKMNGTSLLENINFSRAYTVTFIESGLPVPSAWFVNISGQIPIMSESKTATAYLPNGSYNYSASMSNQTYSARGGSFVVRGLNVSLDVNFVEVVFSVSLTETGLPLDSKWYWNITGQGSYSSTNSTIIIVLPNSTYFFTIATADKEYTPVSPTGTFTVSGAPYSGLAIFKEVLYNVTFNESGLTLGGWYVNISNTSQSFYEPYPNQSITFNEPNGTYFYTIATADKEYTPLSPTGTFTVSGNNVYVNVLFSGYYLVVFNESGLPLMTKWEIKIGNRTYVSSSNSLKVLLPNGAYQYSAILLSKMYSNEALSGHFNVENNSVYLRLVFTSSYTDTALLFIPSVTLMILFLLGTFIYKRLTR